MAPPPVTGLILSGGGARAAYQVGVLAGIAELLPAGAHNPFPVIVGTSAGAINAVTLASGADPGAALPGPRQALIVGQVDDEAGLQALVVAIDGTTDRPDGSTYHITWSLDRARGRHAVDSNEVIARLGWRPLAAPVPVGLQAVRL